MKLRINYLPAFAFFIFACGDAPKTNEGEPATPKALQDNTSSYKTVSKRGYDNVVDQLYAEITEQDTALDRLEKAINELPGAKEDSLSAFYSFDQKNSSYYESAKVLVKNMPDSALRKFADSILNRSIKKYNTLVSRHEQLESLIEEQTQRLKAAHALCKLVYTVPAMEKFQKQLPALSPLEGYKKQVENITEKTTQLVDKKLK